MTSEQQSDDTDRGLEKFDVAIVEDRGLGVEALQTVKTEADADEVLRLTESQCQALLQYDRALAPTRSGSRVVVEMLPDAADDRLKPVEIRSVGTGTDQGGQTDQSRTDTDTDTHDNGPNHDT